MQRLTEHKAARQLIEKDGKIIKEIIMGKTSNEVKRRYNSKAYKKLTIEIKKEFYEMLDQYSKESGESKTSFICRMIKEHACNNLSSCM